MRPQRCTQNPFSLQGTEGSFSINSEEYEAMPVEVALLPRKLQLFCDPRKREQMLQGRLAYGQGELKMQVKES
ncbi:hypothetical protein ACRRTK_015890 [Alexandromys fortis]